jgi:hypothetical protein
MGHYIFATLVICSSLVGCASNPISGEKEPMVAARYCTEQLPQPFIQDGHLYTTLSVSDIAGYSEPRQLALSYYSQYSDIDPDYEAVSVSFKYLLLPWKWEWRNNITGVLHSLHGGGRQDIDERRKNIRNALSKTLKIPELDWLSGLLIHADGDSYAHTKNEYNSKDERAYNVWIGHAIPNLLGRDPDNIKMKLNEPKYLGYAKELYATLKKDSGKDQLFNNFIVFVEELKCKDGLCPNFHALFNKEDMSKNSRIDVFMQCMNNTSRPLSKIEVQQAINLIKGGNP